MDFGKSGGGLHRRMDTTVKPKASMTINCPLRGSSREARGCSEAGRTERANDNGRPFGQPSGSHSNVRRLGAVAGGLDAEHPDRDNGAEDGKAGYGPTDRV